MSASAIAPARPLSADRRSFLAAGMATVVATSAFVPIAAAPVLHLCDELNAYEIRTLEMNAGRHTEAEWQRYDDMGKALFSRIEALPTTPENAKLKARAIMSLVDGDLDDVGDGDNTCDRLVRQILAGLLGDA